MPRTLPAQLTTELDRGRGYTPFFAIGKRNYTGTPPSSLASYTRLITDIRYYKYNGLDLIIKYHSINLPEDDGLTIGERYYFERGVTVNGTIHSIRSASLRLDDYELTKQIITCKFSLFSGSEKFQTISGYDSYTNILNSLNPNDYFLGTVSYKTTPENPSHWSYKFFGTGKNIVLKNQKGLLPLLHQKYLIHAVDNSDSSIEDEIQYFHLSSPFFSCSNLSTLSIGSLRSFCHSPELNLYVAVGYDFLAPYEGIATSTDATTWTKRSTSNPTEWVDICWSSQLSLFVAVGRNGASPQIATSPDGITWTYRTSAIGATYAVRCVIWVDELDLFIAGGDAGAVTTSAIQTSPDGITWTARTTPSCTLVDICYSPELGMLAANGGTKIITSPDGITWTERYNSLTQLSICWSSIELRFVTGVNNGGSSYFLYSTNGITWTGSSPLYNIGQITSITYADALLLFVAVGQTDATLISPDGINWKKADADTHPYVKIRYIPSLSKIIALWTDASTGGFIQGENDDLVPDHEITQNDVTLRTDQKPLTFTWKNEGAAILTEGYSDGPVHNLGYLEAPSNALLPNGFRNTDRGNVTTIIHLKYKTGDIIKLSINATQSATYHAIVTEIFDPEHFISWRSDIELFERSSNTNAGSVTPSIEQTSPYIDLPNTDFSGILDSSVTNLERLVEVIDSHTH
jgi:hypothetical protein